jgi:hypothetical protein
MRTLIKSIMDVTKEMLTPIKTNVTPNPPLIKQMRRKRRKGRRNERNIVRCPNASIGERNIHQRKKTNAGN